MFVSQTQLEITRQGKWVFFSVTFQRGMLEIYVVKIIFCVIEDEKMAYSAFLTCYRNPSKGSWHYTWTSKYQQSTEAGVSTKQHWVWEEIKIKRVK